MNGGPPSGTSDGAGSPGPASRRDTVLRRDTVWWPLLVLVVATVFWTGGGVVARSAPMGGPQLGFLRSVVAALLYQGVFLARGGRIRWSSIRTAAPAGASFGLSVAALFAAFRTTSFVSANVIGALQPLVLVPLTARIHHHRMGWRAVGLIGVVVAGTALVTVGSSAEGRWSLGGDLLALLAMGLGCGYTLGTKAARRHLDTLEFMGAALTVAAVATFPAALVTGDGLGWPSWSDLGWALLLVVVGGTGHVLFAWSQRFLSVVVVATVALIEIPEAATSQRVVFGEPVSWLQVAGIVVMVTALAVFVRREAALDDVVVVDAPVET